MARPLTAQPDLPILLTTGKALAARDNLVDPAIQTGPAVMVSLDLSFDEEKGN